MMEAASVDIRDQSPLPVVLPRNTLKRPSGDTEGGREKEGLRMFWPRSLHMFLDMKDFMSERSEAKSHAQLTSVGILDKL